MAAVASSRSGRFNNFFGPVQPLPSSSSSSRFYSSSSSSKAFASSSSQLSSSSTVLGSSSHVIGQQTSMRNNKKTCMCSPTNHPGSFRCSLHKNNNGNNNNNDNRNNQRLNARRSAMTNSLVRIGTVEGDLVKRALAALIRPSSHHQKRRSSFQPRRPSRLSIMSY